MATNSAQSFFSGWLGIGTGFTSGVLVEPTDAAYARRPIQFGPLVGGQVNDLFPGTIGPASTSWGTLLYAGLFDAASGGTLLTVWPLARPLSIGPGKTWTVSNTFGFTLALDPAASVALPRVWVAGSLFGTTRNSQPMTACQNLQLANGQLFALLTSVATGTTTTLANGAALPTVSPSSGSGQLWNNGGVICVA